ncbi:DUF5133 domain-containing protein [Streptomyces sp. GC420]|uniref:DUF5133 domain-containing protein n=1 Tax=Streptomyces sp. GC420 TaxID=2697568 RepID=UPI0028BE4CBC|nr:DUF5133 domain-containing protein [Streptomyces sp. GC420]
MITSHPKLVRTLLARFADLRIGNAYRETADTARELEHVIRSLCAATGTATLDEALRAADALLEQCCARRAPTTGAGTTGTASLAV